MSSKVYYIKGSEERIAQNQIRKSFEALKANVYTLDFSDTEGYYYYRESDKYASRCDIHSVLGEFLTEYGTPLPLLSFKTIAKKDDVVLVRDYSTSLWQLDVLEEYDYSPNGPYKCRAHRWNMCLPYKGNEHLFHTTNLPENVFVGDDSLEQV